MQSGHLTELLERAEVITSDDRIGEVDTPFRILAGPGAGKTYWLVRRIKDVIEWSDRLGPNQRIACISYTRVAAGEVEKGLGSAAAHADVSTIHSFLYRNIVKPYLPWVCDEGGSPSSVTRTWMDILRTSRFEGWSMAGSETSRKCRASGNSMRRMSWSTWEACGGLGTRAKRSGR